MVPFDQTTKSIQKLKGRAAKGKLAPEDAEKKIAALQKKGSTWVARWEISTGREATKGGFKTKKAAEAYEAQQRAKVASGDSSPPMYQRATVAEIVAFYLENRMAGKVSAANVKPHLERAVSVIGSLRLETSESDESGDSDPDRIGLKRSQFSRVSPSSREIVREIGGGA